VLEDEKRVDSSQSWLCLCSVNAIQKSIHTFNRRT